MRRARRIKTTGKTLQHRSEFDIKFNEVDSMAVVWHGNYIRFFEDGREAWGKKYGLSYLDVYNNNYFTPIVKSNCEYLSFLKYGDTAIIETTFIDTPAAKLQYHYKIYRKKDGVLAATGETTQVFIDHNYELCLSMPDFFENWKKKWNLL